MATQVTLWPKRLERKTQDSRPTAGRGDGDYDSGLDKENYSRVNLHPDARNRKVPKGRSGGVDKSRSSRS